MKYTKIREDCFPPGEINSIYYLLSNDTMVVTETLIRKSTVEKKNAWITKRLVEKKICTHPNFK